MNITAKDLLKIKPLIIAGPCAVESKEQITDIAKKLHQMGVKVLRCQLWKPRTDPTSFQGIGLKGLAYLKELKDKYGFLIATEITDKDQINQTKGVVDILWVGSRNMQNYELLKALGKDNRPVILKRGFISTISEWMGAGKYIGLGKVILCERGVRTGADSMRFTLDINAALVAKYDHKIPVIIDPSHTAGRSDMVPKLAYAGIAAGADGIVVEVHSHPEKALSDASQQITPKVFKELLDKVNAIYKIIHLKESSDISWVNPAKSANKKTRTRLSLAVVDRVGILKDILTVFADFDINLNKLESHPSKNKQWDYYFEVEVESGANEPRLVQALNILKKLCPSIKILGEP